MNAKTTLGTILMFDDQVDRGNRRGVLTKLTGCTVEFIDLCDKDVLEAVKETVKGFPDVDIVLVDYILDKTSSESQELLQKGTSLAPIIREHWPASPVIAVTEAYEACRKNMASEVFDDIVRFNQLSWLAGFIPSIISGYQRIQQSSNSLDELLTLVGVPDSQKSALAAILPEDVKTSLGQMPEFAHHVFRWFRSEFYKVPGPLYDSKWASMLLGIGQEWFTEYQSAIEEAKYFGVFGDCNDLRWWKATIFDIVLPNSSQRFYEPIQKAACEKLSVPEEHFSMCYKCNEKWPEVIASVDEAETADMHPMHLKCTVQHSSLEARPFFEEYRVMLGDDR